MQLHNLNICMYIKHDLILSWLANLTCSNYCNKHTLFWLDGSFCIVSIGWEKLLAFFFIFLSFAWSQMPTIVYWSLSFPLPPWYSFFSQVNCHFTETIFTYLYVTRLTQFVVPDVHLYISHTLFTIIVKAFFFF